MADIVTQGTQTVAAGDAVTFALNRIWTRCPNIRHEPLSGRVTLLPGLYRVSFNGNFSSTETGNVSFEIEQDGEGIPGSVITNTIAAATDIYNGSATVEVRVCCPCCATLTVRNIGTVPATVDNANLVITRVG